MFAFRVIAGLAEVKAEMTVLHSKVSDATGGDDVEEALAGKLTAAGEKYNTWNARATSRIREDKRLKSQVWAFALTFAEMF